MKICPKCNQEIFPNEPCICGGKGTYYDGAKVEKLPEGVKPKVKVEGRGK